VSGADYGGIRRGLAPAVLALGAAGTLAVGLYAGPWDAPWDFSAALLIIVWALTPYLWFYFVCRNLNEQWGDPAFLPVTLSALVLTVPALALYIDAFFIHITSMAGLLFWVVPAVQHAAGLLLSLAMRILAARSLSGDSPDR